MITVDLEHGDVLVSPLPTSNTALLKKGYSSGFFLGIIAGLSEKKMKNQKRKFQTAAGEINKLPCFLFPCLALN